MEKMYNIEQLSLRISQQTELSFDKSSWNWLLGPGEFFVIEILGK